MSLLQLSGYLLFTAFICYLIALVLFGGAIKPTKVANAPASAEKWGKLAITVTIIGFIANLGYFILRWIYTGHAPVSNMFEFTTAFGMFVIAAFIVSYFMYRVAALGVVALPIAILIIGYAAMFPREVSPLVPSLQSHWLTIHVITAAMSQAVLALSAVAGLVYLLKHVDVKKASKERFFLEAVMFSLVLVIGFIVSSITFSAMGYSATYQYIDKEGRTGVVEYHNPALFGMNEYIEVKAVDPDAKQKVYEPVVEAEQSFQPLVEMPAIINAKKLTTVVYSVLFGTVIYLLIRLISRRSISEMVQPLVQKVNSSLADEIGYRAVLIGFPLFTLGALIFAMIWAHEAWSRFWGWDPKEVWALITWLFYAAFLHLRLSKGWEGKKSAWLALIGFGIIMFNLVVVNLILAGLHSYA
ncbi:c-type cytochrome biogenesis protein CcsB [Metasolibacillus sp.]|uniref:c-type cytochrome biogenesis protein CcsB n=1 Tax=Metasolibacillus sp. TaxID=2703680 RepID=UPI0025D50B99|nr:c-type cytochrome biogenesis protein CcsB [Metasolibacillus sp.]MCT6923693.1 c-type cytochrome biogenesis protein CcsB [Metasolibacillus sp.]MCT6939584.1 c-type cytochrome biogenesis protein CcsB [Metasolibacillus sp.]